MSKAIQHGHLPPTVISGGFRGGPRGPRPPLLSENFFSFVNNICRMVLRALLLKIYFLRPLMIAPITSATVHVEHSSSSLRLVKSGFRSTMREDRLNALLLLFVHKDIALDYDVIIDDDAKCNQRRMTFINPLQWMFL